MAELPRRNRTARLSMETLEDRTTPTFGLSGGESIAVGDVFPELNGSLANEIVVGSGPGSPPYVTIYDLNGNIEQQFLAYEQSFTGGVNVALADAAADSPGTHFKEIVTGTGVGGGPLVKIFDLKSTPKVTQFFAYESTFRGGVNVAGLVPASAFTFPAGGGTGIRNTFGTDQIVTGSGPGGGPAVKVFTNTGALVSSWFAYESTFRDGVNVATGNILDSVIHDSPQDEVATGSGVGGAPLLKVFQANGTLRQAFFAFNINDRNGLNVAVGDTDGGVFPGAGFNSDEIFAVEAYTPLTQAPRIRSFNGATSQIESDFDGYPAGFTQYVNMAVGNVATKPGQIANIGDLVLVSGEGDVNPPRVYYGVTASAAGNNGP